MRTEGKKREARPVVRICGATRMGFCVSRASAPLLLLAAAFLPVLSARGADREFNPPVTAVTVYPDRALVTRSVTVHLPRGKHILSFREAAPLLEPESLRAFSRHPDFIIQGINSHLERKTLAVNPEIRALEKKKDELERKKEEQNRKHERAGQDAEGVEHYYKFLSESVAEESAYGSGKKGVIRWNEAREFLLRRRMESLKVVQKTEEAIRKLDEKIESVSGELNKLKTAGEKNTRTVRITLLVVKEREAAMGFSYIMRNAGWNVSYGMYLRPDRSVFIEYYGNIRQKTGEDWMKARVSLSTARPSLGARRPRLHPVVVRGRKAQVRQVVVNSQEKSVARDEPGGGKPAPGKETGAGGYANLDDSGSALVFRITGKRNIPSGKRRRRVTIARFSTKPIDIYYRVVGRAGLAAYMTTALVNGQPFPLMAGQADIYLRSGFIGRSRIDFTPAGAPFLVGFGIDRNIRVKRELNHYQDKAGMLSSDRIFRTRIQLTISNPAGVARRVSVFERIPISELEEVSVAVLKDTTGGYKIDKKDSGILRWDLNLAPGASTSITLHYSVRVPSGIGGSFYGD